ncbi:RagB/SusD family nutrient uptake outer membrane protein [Chitinophaga rhizophila]|uniref:RagB/SusD family nutrient uptake outer membrane protein n=1 Tax=Chitinophaga rhizophila TaxID=2866212 RepID=A0ABS7GNA7_9BACT|nr:RagB/SusD family nutrient uptake outer membrane protein [Chitinophaga rhizophila]MBW8688303.1 RagB/SusD family nutrient uptake outer membrane protein [Chitinophaga rhizophila]
MIRYILLAAVVCIMGSCEKLLDVDPSDKLSNETVFSDLSGARAALVGAYSSLLTLDKYHGNRMIYPDLVAGNLLYSKTTNVRLMDLYSFLQDAETSSMNSTYTDYYSFLNNVNNILAAATRLGDTTNAAVRRLEAEARCLRALGHFDLLRLFSRPYTYTQDASHPGIVINLAPRLYNDPLPQRSSATVSYKAVTDDLETALRYFANTTPLLTGGYTQNTFNAVSAEALLAKVYLYQEKWQQAYMHADNVIRTGGRTLMTNQQYVASWTTRVPSSESILELALEANFAGTTLGNYYGDNGPEQQYEAHPSLYTLYRENDVRGLATLFVPKTISGRIAYFTAKYKGAAANATPIKVLRLSDIVLIRAEAAAHLSNLQQGYDDLNLIRMRADTSEVKLGVTDMADLLYWIRQERRKEFAFEGEYFFDLIREKRGLPAIPFEDYRMVLPLPKTATDVNPSLKQNNGY